MTHVVKYIVVPGYVWSTTDGDRHWITADRLMHLYGVDPRECRVLHLNRADGDAQYKYLQKNFPALIYLQPRPDGNYRLPGSMLK